MLSKNQEAGNQKEPVRFESSTPTSSSVMEYDVPAGWGWLHDNAPKKEESERKYRKKVYDKTKR